jgi:hypothetical protein
MKDKCGYGGMAVIDAASSPAYMSNEYLALYGDMLSKASALGMKVNMYDEYSFPSGRAGGQFEARFPNDRMQRLEMIAEDVTGPMTYTKTIPSGTLMGCVAMDNSTKARTDITANVSGNLLTYTVPAGSYKIMMFTCVIDGYGGVCDYLAPAAVEKFISLVHQKYYDKWSTYFGNVLDMSFYDEPTMCRVAGGRAWTPNYNTWFLSENGFSPVAYYPSLWYDIGPATAAARNALFGFRAQLYAKGFTKTLNDWCEAHHIQLTGHQDQEELVNPVGSCGDLMKSYKYQAIPGVDNIFFYSRGAAVYKIISSVAYNWDKSLVSSEAFGASTPSEKTMYMEAMDEYAKGINFMIPHSAWLNKCQIKPRLDEEDDTYAAILPNFTKYVGRLNIFLQGGRHIADIGMLYPIAALNGNYAFGKDKDPTQGDGTIPREADYIELGEQLSLVVRRDYTWVHPEVLAQNCIVNSATLKLNNATNFENYKVFIMPGSKTISWPALQKIKQFYDNGGKVITTTELPYQSSEFNHDTDVQNTIRAMFDTPVSYPGSLGTYSCPIADASTTYMYSCWSYEVDYPKFAIDGNPNTKWNAAEKATVDEWLEIDFGKNTLFDKTIVRESGTAISAYYIQYWDGSSWLDCATGTTIGVEKTNAFTAVTASKVRLYIAAASGRPQIAEFEVYSGNGSNLVFRDSSCHEKTIDSGGKSYFIGNPTTALVTAALDDAMTVYDVEFESDPVV